MERGREEYHRIAVLQTAFLGDVVFTSPLVAALHAAWPGAQLTLVTRPTAVAIAEAIPGVSRALGFDKRGADRGLAGLRRAAAALGSPDLVVSPHGSLRSALLARMSGAATRVGPASALTRALYTHPVSVAPGTTFTERFLAFGRALGADAEPLARLVAPAGARLAAERLVGTGQAVALVIGSEWATKIWPAESYGALAVRVAAAGWTPLLIGAPRERPIAEAVKAAAPGVAFVDCVGNTIAESLGLLAQARAAVGGDSGLVHAARALGTPTAVLFGPTASAVHRFERHAVPVSLGLDCQPCHRHGPKRCPRGHHDCMRRLEVDRVWDVLCGLAAGREVG